MITYNEHFHIVNTKNLLLKDIFIFSSTISDPLWIHFI